MLVDLTIERTAMMKVESSRIMTPDKFGDPLTHVLLKVLQFLTTSSAMEPCFLQVGPRFV